MAFPISGRFMDAIRGPFRWLARADVWYDGVFIQSVPITDGSISIDRTANTRRSCTVTVGDPNFIPLYAASALAPYGAELRIYLGVKYADESEEMVPMGIFSIYSVTWTDGSNPLPVVTGYDYGKKIEDAGFIAAVDLSGYDAFDRVTHLAQDLIVADVNFDESLETYTLPGGSVFDGSRWDCITSICTPMGAEAFFDVFGNLTVQPVPAVSSSTTDDDIAWTVDCGPNGVLVNAARVVTRDGVYNFVTAKGTSTTDTGAPPIAYAADNDPSSPTYWGPSSEMSFGRTHFTLTPFGQVVFQYENSNMTTNAQCLLAAQTQLKQVLGVQKQLNLDMVPNVSLDAGDIVKVVFQDGAWEYHLLDTLTIDINGGGCSATTRSTIGQLPTI